MKRNKIDEIDINETLSYILNDIKAVKNFIYKHGVIPYNNCIVYPSLDMNSLNLIIIFLNDLVDISKKYNIVTHDIRDNVRDIVEDLELKNDYMKLLNILMDLYKEVMSNMDKDGVDDNPSSNYVRYSVYPLLFMIINALYDKLNNEKKKKEIENGV